MFSMRLKAMREERQLSQEELAVRVGVSGKQIWRYESDQNVPTADVLLRIAKELGVSMDYLSGLTDEPQGHFSEDALDPMERKLLAAWRHEDMRKILELLMQITKNPDQ